MADLIVANDIAFTTVREQEGWEFKPRRFKWVASAAWWLLGKMRALAPHMGTYRVYRFREPKRNDDIHAAVFEAIKGRIRSNADMRDYACLMGMEDFRRLMNDSSPFQPLGSRPFQFNAGPFGYRNSIFDVPVHVVETVKGVALVPKVIIERPQPPEH